ncbi:MAG: glutamate--tRNA ligase [Deltaproteobacteria bacterium]|nr:glutamate--tRNA ligase [Deltaproteobacteria bacterium]MBW2661083.1 glutamate--tRNA ligase [Deltaproteobacteria bacterium]
MSNIVTRFPPSPTGYLHVGGARTALFNWLYARHTKGRFVLRIEDTDTKRSTQASVDAIFEALEWLGIDWDDGPYFQSRRFDIYQTYIQKLLDSGHAYYCTCSQEKIDAMRKKALASGGKPKYDGTCRDKDLAKTDNAVIRFRAPITGATIVKDIIKGNVVFQNSEQDDFIICRSDGTPTYNFVVVVDDITMGINTVIRGDDHLNNTPRQIMLYNALESPLPAFGHVPMVLGKDRTRLSKRHGATSVTVYRDMGYLPDALINYLVRLGWSHGDQEFFPREELIEKFTLENIGKSAGIFDQEKLLALNADHIKAASPENLSNHLLPFLKERGCMAEKGDFLDSVIKTLNTRSKTLIDMADGALFYFQENILYEEKAAKKFLKPALLETFKQLIDLFEQLEPFNKNNLENAFKKVMETTGLKFGKIAQPLRVALTGKTVSPGIFELIEALGKKQVISRLQNAGRFIKNRKD